jgi:predicted nucleic acid-binding protein
MILLDTDVMVDILRGNESAKVWLQSIDEIGMPGLVAMELIH